MKRDNIFETLLSAAVIVVAVGFLAYAYATTGRVQLSDYELTAEMAHPEGLVAGASDVLIAGYKVGTVSDLTLDPKTYRAIVHIKIRAGLPIPKDSRLSVTTPLMSPQSALSITPGRSSQMLAPGEQFAKAS